ncbi:MAG: outer membrane beta-barrel protein [Deltaproteobacteria bacterium]|nr:outer membrane beta-barrel protein [Deltaproteobacteria bacterium]
MKKRLLLTGIFVAFLLVFCVAQVSAEIIWRQGAVTVEDELSQERGRIHIGKVTVIPGIRLSGNYDSNIFLGNGYTSNPNNPGTTTNGKLNKPVESDYIFNVNPGLLINYDLGDRGHLNLGYEGAWAFYNDYTVQNWNNQRGILDFDYKAPSGLIAGLRNVYNNGNDPYGDATQFGLGFTQKRWNNDLNAKLGWDFFNRFKVIGFYNLYKQEYQDVRNSTQNWTDNVGGLEFACRVLPKTWAFVRYHYGTQSFDDDQISSANDASNKRNRISGGLAWDGGGKLGGELNFGWQWLDYDNDIDTQGNTYENRNTWSADTSIDYRATETTALTLNITRAIRTTGAARQEYYDDTQVGINVFQDLPYKFSANGGFVYSKNDYNTLNTQLTEDRVDDNYNVYAGVTYKIRTWLDASLNYRYMKKDSNDVTQSFTDNQVSLSLGAAY